MRKINIAIDGYSSCGKSTMAKQIADIIGYLYIDSGAMYRAVTLYAVNNGYISDAEFNKEAIIKALPEMHIVLEFNPEEKTTITFLNGKNVEEEIRTMQISNKVNKVSEIKEVRDKLIDLQRKMAENRGVVMDGRDIGTVVIPDAELKLFMTADTDVRVQRRFNERISKGDNIKIEEVIENIKLRDEKDVNRKYSPLIQAEDAIILDNSYLTEEEQLSYTIGLINKLVTEKVG